MWGLVRYNMKMSKGYKFLQLLKKGKEGEGMKKRTEAKCSCSLKSGPKHLNYMAYVVFSNCKIYLASINDIFIFMNTRLLPTERTPRGQRWEQFEQENK